MVRLAVLLVILVIALIVRFFVWLATPKKPPMVYPSGGYGAGGPFGRPGGFGPPMGGMQQGYGGPPMGGMQQGYGGPPMGGMQQGYGAPPMGGMQQGYGGPPMGGMQQGYGGPPMGGMQHGHGAPALGMGAPVRVLARPDCTFGRICATLNQSGFQMVGAPGAAVQPEEPGHALWRGPSGEVRYSFDPSTYSRMLEISGPQAEPLRAQLQAALG